MPIKPAKFLYSVVKPVLLVMLGAGWFALISGRNWPLVRLGGEIDQPTSVAVMVISTRWMIKLGR
jgi:hypothetical protein